MTAVLIIDDSALMRQMLTAAFAAAHDISVDTALDPLFALEKMKRRWPDVIVLDLEMPRMDGMTFLKKVMAERPTPVVVCSTLTEKGAEASVRALAAGAVSVFPKNQLKAAQGAPEVQQALVSMVREAAASRVSALGMKPAGVVNVSAPSTPEVSLVALGASTGGTIALEQVLVALPADVPPIVLVQHMPEKFTLAFAQRLDSLTKVRVHEAKGGEVLERGHVYIAPGGRHMSLVSDGGALTTRVFDAPHVNRHKPSVDVLFNSVAKLVGSRTLAMLMTGMGDDGARGLLALRQSGAMTVAQDEATSIVFGMPAEAIKLGAAQQVLPLQALAQVIAACRGAKQQAA
ncbi:MAG: chemotaxis response regulator protein-glutamate methylesterase [Archangiaceae bacterium]|nr:chemotaxis response regulator protein-glutamate methylesterase [Archangiaceae bacterium]